MRYVATLLLLVAQAAAPLTGSLQWCLRADGARHLEGGPLARLCLASSSAPARPTAPSFPRRRESRPCVAASPAPARPLREGRADLRCVCRSHALDAGDDPAPCEGAHVRVFPPQPPADRQGPSGPLPALSLADAWPQPVVHIELAAPSVPARTPGSAFWDCCSSPLRC